MKVDVYNIQGKKTGRQLDLPDNIFGVEPNEHSIYLAVKQYLANQRQGTHKSRERGEIRGSMRKIKKQKGTGTARAGTMKNPLYRGGGRMFGPRPRVYSLDLNKKVKLTARRSALSAKANSGNLIILEDFTFDSPKTSEYTGILNNLELGGMKTTLVTGDLDKTLVLSARNIKNANVVVASDLNTYQVMRSGKVLVSESAVDKLKEALA